MKKVIPYLSNGIFLKQNFNKRKLCKIEQGKW